MIPLTATKILSAKVFLFRVVIQTKKWAQTSRVSLENDNTLSHVSALDAARQMRLDKK